MKTILENVSRNFYAFMDEQDLRVLKEYKENTLDNFVVDATLPEFRIRFVRNRERIEIWVGSRNERDWYQLSQVLELLLKTPISTDTELLTAHLRSEYSRIAAAINEVALASSQ